jgi:cytochrome P450
MAGGPDGPHSWLGLREIVRFRRDPLRFVEENAREYGDIVGFRLGRNAAYQVNHPDLVRELLVAHAPDHLRGPVMQRARAVMGNGLLTSEEPAHGEQRRALRPLFHRQRLAAYAEIVEQAVEATCSRWSDSDEIDVRSEMLQLSLEVVGRSLFGADLRDETQRIAEAVNASMLMMNTVFFPWPDLLLRLPLAPMRRFRRGLAHLDRIIDRLMVDAERGQPDGHDGIAGWLSRHATDTNGLSPAQRRQIRDECVTFLLAGHETVANALTFALLLVAQNAAVADRIADEAAAAEAQPAIDRLDGLPYARAVLAEAMRLFPPVWILARQTKTPSTIGPHAIATGSIVFVCQWLVHRDPRFFDDPLRFTPERFLESGGGSRSDGRRLCHAYFPFGAGSRQCIGEGFAWMEGTLALAAVARRWRLRLISAPDPPLAAALTLRPASKVVISVTTRSTAPR